MSAIESPERHDPPDATESAAIAAASSDALPALLSQLLHDVSVECARMDGWSEHKQLIQSKIKGQAAASSEPAASVAASSAPLSFGSLPAFPSDESASASSVAAPSVAASSMAAMAPASSSSIDLLSVPSSSVAAAPDAASSDSLPSESLPLLRQLSSAAALGVISHSTKVEIKNLLLNARVSSVLAHTRLVRGITETGEETVTEQQIDTSTVDPQQATQMQDEEREALEAIYEGMVTFGESLETEGQDDEDADQNEEQGQEQKQQQTDDDDGDGGEDEEGEEEDNQGEDDEDEDEDEEAPAEPADAAAATTPASESASAASASVAASASAPAPPAVLCRTVDIDVLPYPASSARNPVSAVLRFTLPPLYPFVRPSFRLLSVKGELLQSDGLMMGTAINEQLNAIYAKGEPLSDEDARPCIFDLVTAAQEFLIEYVGFLEDAAYHKRIAEEAVVRAAKQAKLAAVHDEQRKHAAAFLQKDHKKIEWSHVDLQPLVAGAGKGPQPTASSPKCKARVSDFSGLMPTPEELAAHIHAFDRHFKARCFGADFVAQSVVSPFLVYRFMKTRATMAALGQPTKVDVAFHGTAPKHVRSIASHGLVIPGQTDLNVTHARNTGFYGLGIYVSPYPSYAADYGGLDNLFTCLVLRGRSYPADYSMGRSLEPGYQTHHNASGKEWVIFDAAAVLPIYLLNRTVRPIQKNVKSKAATADVSVRKIKIKAKKPKLAPTRR